jgi:hypothetical protein
VDFKALAKALRGVHEQTHAAASTATHTVTRVIRVEKRLQHGIGEDVLPRIKTLEREYTHVIGRDIPALWKGTRTAEREITNLWKWARHRTLVAGTLAFAGAVALALSRLKIGWLRCGNVSRVGKNICGMDGALLEALLADSLLIAGSLSLVEFAREMVGVTDTAVRPITTFWRAS